MTTKTIGRITPPRPVPAFLKPTPTPPEIVEWLKSLSDRVAKLELAARNKENGHE